MTQFHLNKVDDWKNLLVSLQKKTKQSLKKFEKVSYKLLVNAAFGEMIENVRNRLTIEFIKEHDFKEIITQQPKITFIRTHKSYENCDSYTSEQNEV